MKADLVSLLSVPFRDISLFIHELCQTQKCQEKENKDSSPDLTTIYLVRLEKVIFLENFGITEQN